MLGEDIKKVLIEDHCAHILAGLLRPDLELLVPPPPAAGRMATSRKTRKKVFSTLKPSKTSLTELLEVVLEVLEVVLKVLEVFLEVSYIYIYIYICENKL